MQPNFPTHVKELIALVDSQLAACDDPLLSTAQAGTTQQGVVTERYLFLEKGQFFFGILMDNITELSPLGPVTPLPNLPMWINGVTSLRGEVISAIDLPTYLHWVSTVDQIGEHIVAVESDGIQVGICVDRIVGSGNVDPLTEIDTQVKAGKDSDVVFAKAHNFNGQICCIIDAQELLAQDKMLQW